MSRFESSFKELLQSLSLAQVSIEQTTTFVLNHASKFDSMLNIWEETVQKADVEKLKCLLYLANDIIQRIPDKISRLKLVNRILEIFDNFKTPEVLPVFSRIVKVWEERKVFGSDIIDQFNLLIKNIQKTDSDAYNVSHLLLKASKLLHYIKSFNVIENYLSQHKPDSGNFIKEFDTAIKLHNYYFLKAKLPSAIDRLTSFLNLSKKLHKAQLASQVNAVRVEEFKQHFNSLHSSAETSLEKYNEFRNRIIQLRWKIERVQKNIKTALDPNHDNFLKGEESHDVADMEVEVSAETEPKNNQQKLNQLMNIIPSFPLMESSSLNFGLLPDPNIVHPSFLHNMYGPIQPGPDMRFMNEPSYSTPTVVDYNHGKEGVPLSQYAVPPYLPEYQHPPPYHPQLPPTYNYPWSFQNQTDPNYGHNSFPPPF